MPTTTNFGWTTPADTDLVKDGAAAIRTLAGNIDTSLVDLKGGTTGQVLSKASNTDLDFSFITPASSGITLIQETVASANTSIDFNSIPGTSKDLILYWEGLHQSTGSDEFTLRFNSDSGSNYILYENYYEITSWSIVRNAVTYASQKMFGAAATSTTPADTIRGSIRIYNYASASKVKFYEHRYAFWDNGASRNNFVIGSGYYNSATAITSLNIVRTNGSGNLTNLANTSIRLVGVA